MNSLPPLQVPSLQSIAKARQRVRDIDLSAIEKNLQRDFPQLTPYAIRMAIKDYREYLIMLLVFPDEQFTPISKEADMVWHSHILHTRKYEEDCETLFGAFMDHEPAGEDGVPEELIERTKEAYSRIFHGSLNGW